jgi:hypothetical protein
MQTTEISASQAITSMTNETKPEGGIRLRLARQILIFHIALVVISFGLFILKGFDQEEFTALMGMLMPVTAIYAGTVYKFLGGSLTTPDPIKEETPLPQASGTVKVLIYGHFIGMLLLIATKALAPNLLNFSQMTMALTLLETVIGAYMGSLLMSLFK